MQFESFSIDDWVLIRVFPNKKEWMVGKLVANWEGSYEIKVVTLSRACMVKNIKSVEENASWNARHLKMYRILCVLI